MEKLKRLDKFSFNVVISFSQKASRAKFVYSQNFQSWTKVGENPVLSATGAFCPNVTHFVSEDRKSCPKNKVLQIFEKDQKVLLNFCPFYQKRNLIPQTCQSK